MTAMNTHKQPLDNTTQNCLTETDLKIGQKYRGKVRDAYDLGNKILLVTTDRLSAFDRHLATIPYKGQVLNLTSAWWFEATKDLVPNHMVSIVDPNAVLVKKCSVFPIEFVVRGYITGTTNTSLWTQYQNGVREYCGITFKDGLRKNERLQAPVLTPTTKDKVHDKPISPKEIIAEGWMSAADFETAANFAMQLFARGSEIANQHGLILVDTKYEFGRDENGNILLIDEIHTPDSSRYWLASSYEDRFANEQEPENIDKEFLRLWFKKNYDPYEDKALPSAPQELVQILSERYIQLYEMITGQPFDFAAQSEPFHERILPRVAGWLG